MQVKDVFNAERFHVGGRLLAANATGAEHRDLRCPALCGKLGAKGFEPVREFAKRLRFRIDRALEGAECDFVIIARVDHHCVGIGDQGVPIFWFDIGADQAGWVGTGNAHGDNLILQAHFQTQEGHCFGVTVFPFQRLAAG